MEQIISLNRKEINAMKTINEKDAVNLLEEAEKLDRDALKKLQNERLRELVAFVREASPYFKELYRDIPEDFTLTDLPPTGKEELVLRYSDWVTERGIEKQDVLKHLEGSGPVSLFAGKYSALHTSGTTGEPMPMLRDSYHNVIHGAMLKRRLLGEFAEFMDVKKHRRAAVIFTEKGASSYNSYLRTIAANPGYEDNFIVVSTLEPTGKIIKTLDEFRPEQISGYPSALALLSGAQLDGKMDIHPKMIASSAELMTEDIYYMVKKAFNCRIVNNYCSTEGGEAAMACDCPHLHINEDWVIIEPVDRKGNIIPVDSDEWSDGILITDLSNQIQPIIRYRMNDSVRIHSKDEGFDNPFFWMEIRGRTGGVFEFCGHSFLQVYLFKCVENTSIFTQFIQNSPDEMEIRILPYEGEDKKKAFDTIYERFTRFVEEEGCRDYKVLFSDKDLMKNKRGGKAVSYIKNY